MMMQRLRSAVALLCASIASGAFNVTLLVHASTNLTWFGSTGIALQGPRDPILLTSSWVYDPAEIVAYRPSVDPVHAAWRLDTSPGRETWSVATAAVAGPVGEAVDAVAFWNVKGAEGVDGACTLVGFNSARAPVPSGGKGTWVLDLMTSGCTNVNLQVPWSRFAISDDGETAVAWTQGDSGSVTIYAVNAQTGVLRWKVDVPAKGGDYFTSYGVDISADGRWVVYDEGVVGSGQTYHVLSSVDGKPRAAPVLGQTAMAADMSADGSLLATNDDTQNPGPGAFSVWRWNGTQYALSGSAQCPVDAGSHGWILGQYSFGTDLSTNITYIGVGWFDTTLVGDSVVAMYDARNLSAPLAVAVSKPKSSSMSNAGIVVACDGALCVGGLWTQVRALVLGWQARRGERWGGGGAPCWGSPRSAPAVGRHSAPLVERRASLLHQNPPHTPPRSSSTTPPSQPRWCSHPHPRRPSSRPRRRAAWMLCPSYARTARPTTCWRLAAARGACAQLPAQMPSCGGWIRCERTVTDHCRPRWEGWRPAACS